MNEKPQRVVYLLMSSTVTGAEAHVEAVFTERGPALQRRKALMANNAVLGICEYFTIEVRELEDHV